MLVQQRHRGRPVLRQCSPPALGREPYRSLRRVAGGSRDRRHEEAAFSLVELAVCISIVAVAIAIILPAMSFASASARDGKCLANLRSIASAIQIYTATYKTIPYCRTTTDLRRNNVTFCSMIGLLLSDSGLPARSDAEGHYPVIEPFVCPADREQGGRDDRMGISYSYFPNEEKTDPDLYDLGRPIVGDWLFFHGRHKNGAAYADGSVSAYANLPIAGR